MVGIGPLIKQFSPTQSEIAARGASCADRFSRNRLYLPFDPSAQGLGVPR